MKNTKIPSLIPILIMTLITVVMWVSFDVYRALKSSTDAIVPTEVSLPLTPSLDQNTINQIKSRTFLNDSQIPDSIASSSPTPIIKKTPSPTTTPVASESGTTQ